MQTTEPKSISLPFEIEIEVSEGRVNIASELGQVLPNHADNAIENARIVGVIEGMEQLLMSLALCGIDLSDPRYPAALRDCVARLQV